MRKIPPGAEASNILVGEVDFLEKPLSAFIRLNHANFLGDLTEVPVPTRFLFILLGPAVSILSIKSLYRLFFSKVCEFETYLCHSAYVFLGLDMIVIFFFFCGSMQYWQLLFRI